MILVLLSQHSGIQICFITQLSILMMIIILKDKPFWRRSDNILGSLDEYFIVIICYHLIVVSDLVDPIHTEIKETTCYSLITLISIVAVLYISSIFLGVFVNCYESH